MATAGSAPLFDDDPEKNFSLVAALAQNKPINREQRRFQQLVAQIELKRERLKQWQAYSLRYNQRLLAELEPLRAQLRTGQREMALLIDTLLNERTQRHRLGRQQRAQLRDLLLQLAGSLLEEGGDAALEALHDKYSDRSREQEQLSEMERTRALLNEVLDLQIAADHGASSAEELLQYAQSKLEERASADAAQGSDGPSARGPRRSKASAAKAAAAQAQREQAAREVSQSLREVYRKLASALHPDRELDAQARQRKTTLMQRVNQAYEAKDLLTLLTLQLEAEQIDAAHLSSVPPRRLTHYNQILREQLAELDAELDRVCEPFLQIMEFSRGRTVTVADVDRQLTLEIAGLRAVLRDLRADLVAFRNPAQLRDRLKRIEVEDEPDLDQEAELAMLMEAALMDAVRPAPRRRKSRRS